MERFAEQVRGLVDGRRSLSESSAVAHVGVEHAHGTQEYRTTRTESSTNAEPEAAR